MGHVSPTAARPPVVVRSRLARRERLFGPLLALLMAGGYALVVDAPTLGGKLEITVVDRETGEPLACRMHLKNPRGRPHRPRGLPFWHDHFVFDGNVRLTLPNGRYPNSNTTNQSLSFFPHI